MLPLTSLLISDDRALEDTVQGVVQNLDYLKLEVVREIERASLRVLKNDVVMVIIHLTGSMDLDEALAMVKSLVTAKRPVPAIVVSENHRAEAGLCLMRQGVVDYLSRPLDLQRLAYLVDMLTLRARFLARRTVPQPSFCDSGEGLYLTVGIGHMMEQIQRVAPHNSTLLLTGETGTGKTRLARLIHEISPRKKDPFMVVHCGNLSANLIESEMFGHVAGAFTSADRDRHGKFAEAGKGTLLLDDIESLPLALQPKLLRVVDERVFEPVGSNARKSMEARLVVATNGDLEKEVKAGKFRSDLYYRLNVIGFHLPPLRERPKAILPLAQHFIKKSSRQHLEITPEALCSLEDYHWPGNIRELNNVIERAVTLGNGLSIRQEDLPESLQKKLHSNIAAPQRPGLPQENGASLASSKEEAEMACIWQALQKHNNNRLRAAAELGISRMTLYKKMHRYGMMAEKFNTTVLQDVNSL